MDELAEGHAFISYVHEDSEDVDRIQSVLEAAGVKVWRDTESLWAGQDWKLRIKEAITNGALVFVACFSENSRAKEQTYQREELVLAAEQLRLRSPEKAWFIPVRLDDCELPHYDVGAGRTFDSFQRVDLIAADWDAGIARLLAGVLNILAPSRPAPDADVDRGLGARMRDLLLDDAKQIQLEEAVRDATNTAYGVLTNPKAFPTSSDLLSNDIAGHRYLVEQANRYWAEISEPRDALIVGCAWGRERHYSLWTMTMERIANSATQEQGGMMALLELRRYPTTVLLYAAGIAAVQRGNYGALKAVAWDAKSRGDRVPVPMIAVGHPWLPFGQAELTAQLLALQSSGGEITDEIIEELKSSRRGKRHTPVSDHLHDALREPARTIIDDDQSYTDVFDRMEVLFALIAADAKEQSEGTDMYVWGPWYGSFTWRSRYSARGPELQLLDDFESEGSEWEPLRAGLFGGSAERAAKSFEIVQQGAQEARHRRW
ncbi:MAG TPA: toll/interleukin-1 receptor domain-containing protein [Acidimicrobiia bacterium]|nr:toll/interleukin-1 receptor domain-containing protein [Acidimicrobiia bacterium]